jgi:hypothetical protein
MKERIVKIENDAFGIGAEGADVHFAGTNCTDGIDLKMVQ